MREPDPVVVADLFPELLAALVDLLSGLAPSDWSRPTVCGSWTVKDVAVHLLGDDVGNLSRRRDGFAPGAAIASWVELVAFINELNEAWVAAGRRMSPRVICDLLEHVGAQVCEYFGSLDPWAIGGPVSWAGPEPAPVWLDLAREYTERWLHQQHIRDAVASPGLAEPRYLAPVLETFVRALPRTYEHVQAGEGTLVSLSISGPSGGRWSLLKEGLGWRLFAGVEGESDAEAILPQDVAWRVFTRGMSREAALRRMETRGDEALALKALDAVSIIA
jgi:uncharacterized protein (TIGR03083 family)